MNVWLSYEGKADPSRPWYVGYIDHTHLYVTPNPNKPGIGLHIAQIRDYIDCDVIMTRFNWLRAHVAEGISA